MFSNGEFNSLLFPKTNDLILGKQERSQTTEFCLNPTDFFGSHEIYARILYSVNLVSQYLRGKKTASAELLKVRIYLRSVIFKYKFSLED